MALEAMDAAAGYHFSIEIDGISIAQFKEVSGISAEIKKIEHRENKVGGLPVLKMLPGAAAYGDITLKRGKTDSKAVWEWYADVKKGDMAKARKNASIVLNDYTGSELARFNITNAWCSKVSLGALQASGNDVLLEECVITHEGVAPA